jgi:hypothetical protein
MFTAKHAFFALTAFAFPALLGLLTANGTMWAMLKAIYYGEFADGTPLHHVYSGLPIIDQIEAIQVSFWTPIVKEGATRLQAIMLCATLQSCGLWAAIENTRKGEKHWILK